jgi:AI-2 transport protein TqsA
MGDRSFSNIQRFFISAAGAVVLLWGIRVAAPLLNPFLLAVVLAFSVAPLPNWFVHRFKFGKGPAFLMTLAVVVALGLVLLLGVAGAAFRLKQRLPTYQERFGVVHAQVIAMIESKGVDPESISPLKKLTPEKMLEASSEALQALGGILSDGVIVLMIFAVLLIEMVDSGEEERSRYREAFQFYGTDIQRYMAITAETGAINAAANLVLLLALGVDFPILWCIIYFFLNFIPSVGFFIALVPPALLALLMFGWQRALAVAVGYILTNSIVDNLVKPIFMKKGMDVSLLAVVLSLVFWTFLLGSVGAILAIPLTMATTKFLKLRAEGHSLFWTESGVEAGA